MDEHRQTDMHARTHTRKHGKNRLFKLASREVRGRGIGVGETGYLRQKSRGTENVWPCLKHAKHL